MEINISDREDYTVIKFTKNSVLGTEGVVFQDSILDTLDKGVNSIVIDMSMVEYITSWGIGMLVHAFTTVTNRRAKFILAGVNQNVLEILSKVRLNRIFEFRETI
jgi:anti-sigma B factor antagonist